jgi:GNAT superfamily N-acetyltransferase
LALAFILPDYQKGGLGSKMYEEVYRYYLDQPKCYQLIVEDASDNFQKVQDIINSKILI